MGHIRLRGPLIMLLWRNGAVGALDWPVVSCERALTTLHSGLTAKVSVLCVRLLCGGVCSIGGDVV